ncbi:MAG: outer membrane beta-barrel protein [Gemmatimonadota bacterium]
MRRLFVAALLLIVPTAVEAQPRLMVGAGVTAPNGAIADAADPGYHIRAALHVGIPTLPVALRADGALHRLGSKDAALEDPEVLEGALSVVYLLPGVSLRPYVLAGAGTYRVETGATGSTTTVSDTGFQAGFGVVLGQLGLGAFAEIRYVHITSGSTTRLIPLTLGLRL